MREILFVRLVLVASVLALPGRAAPPPSVDECIKNLRTGPDSFVAYLCLGTPGLPERPTDVRKALKEVLRRIPGEPHARIYLALMNVYANQSVETREFTEPLALLEERQLWTDVFLGQLALLEKICITTTTSAGECRNQAGLLDRAEQLARASRNADLIRLATIARIRWSAQAKSLSVGLRAERELDAMNSEPPDWLKLLELSTRTGFASMLGDDFRLRELYANALRTAAPGSITRAAALSGVAAATTQMALEGLADPREAERLLREALKEQEQLNLVEYNSFHIGTIVSRSLLALLLGRTPETMSYLDRLIAAPLIVELLLQGDERERARARQLARESVEPGSTTNSLKMFSLAHAELTTGSRAEGIRWGDMAIDSIDRSRVQEDDDITRIRLDSSRAIVYQTYISDLLDSGPEDRVAQQKAWEVLERLRSRVLLEKLLAREHSPEGGSQSISSIQDIQSNLRDGEALVSFFIWSPRPRIMGPYTRGHSYAMVVTRTTVRTVHLPRGTELEPAVKAWTRMLEDRSTEIGPGSRRLYSELIKPVVDVLPADVSSLILVPDGPLHRLPFDALSENGGPPYLVDRYQLSIVPSASVWMRLRSRPGLPPGIALAFANTPDGPAVAVAETRGEIAPGHLAALLHAREEAEEAVAAFPSGSKLFAGAEATREHLLAADLHHSSLVHFAAHGVMNEREPDESFLLLAPTANGSGVLKVADVPRFDWTGRTVVLSACDTSVGALHLGEGVLSLARGFFAGGASAVIGTLSRVRDDDQRTLFHAFYTELRRGVSVGEAMTSAKRALIRSGAPPAAWANVIVLGDATVRPRAADSFWTSRAFLAGSAAGLVLLVLGLRTRRRKTGASSE